MFPPAAADKVIMHLAKSSVDGVNAQWVFFEAIRIIVPLNF